MNQQYCNLLTDSRNLRRKIAKTGKYFSPVPDIINPELKENTECLVGIMTESGSDQQDVYISSYVYPSLISHNIVSIQPWSGEIVLLCGRGNYYWYEINEINNFAPESIKLGETEYRFLDWCDKKTSPSEIAAAAVTGWDEFIIGEVEQNAGVKSYVFSPWSSEIDGQLSYIKENIENNSNLPVTWLLTSERILPSVQKSSHYHPCEERQYLSGDLVGRWRSADVYCLNRMPRDTLAVMGYRGNMNQDAAFVVGVNQMVTVKDGVIFGEGRFMSGWDNAYKTVGKLQIV